MNTNIHPLSLITLPVMLLLVTADMQAQTAAQIEAVKKTEIRRHVTIIQITENGAICDLRGIGGPNDPQVVLMKKNGKKLPRFNGEYVYPIISSDPFSGIERVLVKGLSNARAKQEMVLLLYPVEIITKPKDPFASGIVVLSTYATSPTEAAKQTVTK
ncbi:MAG: hypothetical protein U1F71_21425 [Verrucomicrobiaceae bacterium]